jgi:two-component system response regulator
MGFGIGGHKLRILLAEDDEDDIFLTREAFGECAYPVQLYIVRDGVQAMDFLRRGEGYTEAPTPDLILLDLNMPRMDGRAVLRECKADPALQHIPVVILTTSNAQEDILGTYRQFANCYIRKPVQMQQFSRIVQQFCIFWCEQAVLPSPHIIDGSR